MVHMCEVSLYFMHKLLTAITIAIIHINTIYFCFCCRYIISIISLNVMDTNLYEGETTSRIARITDVPQEPTGGCSPVDGYQEMPLLPLEIAVEPLIPYIPNIVNHAYAAKNRCQQPSANKLTINESAAIILYTMSWKPSSTCLYIVLNTTL